MNLRESVAAMQQYLTDHPEHAELPVCAGGEMDIPYMNEVDIEPELAEGAYGDDTSTQFSYKVGPYIVLIPV